MRDLLKQLYPESTEKELKNVPVLISSKQICEVMHFTPRTLHRRISDSKNPLGEAQFKREGSKSLWEISVFLDWLKKERTLGRASSFDDTEGGNDE